jgi:hypothetical protein
MNATGPSAPRRGALSISSRPSISRRSSVSARFATSKQTWWKPSPLLARKRATPVVSSVGSTSSTLRLADREEGDPDPVPRDVLDLLELQPEAVTPEPRRVVDRADDQRDVVDPAEPADVLRHPFDPGRHPDLLRR